MCKQLFSFFEPPRDEENKERYLVGNI